MCRLPEKCVIPKIAFDKNSQLVFIPGRTYDQTAFLKIGDAIVAKFRSEIR